MANTYWQELVNEAYRCTLRALKAQCEEDREAVIDALCDMSDVVQMMDVYIRSDKTDREVMRQLGPDEIMAYVYSREKELRAEMQESE